MVFQADRGAVAAAVRVWPSTTRVDPSHGSAKSLITQLAERVTEGPAQTLPETGGLVPAKMPRAEVPETLRSIEPLVTDDVTPNRTVHLQARTSRRRGVDWRVEGEAHHHGDPVRVGELQVWDVVNETKLDHPFHLHGFFFQVLDVNGAPPEFLSWEDTINVPAKGRVRIAWLPDNRPGSWMYHCHILEHHAAGMMAHFDVIR